MANQPKSTSQTGASNRNSKRSGETSRRGPSLAALASLSTLAICLWFNIELSTALFRSILVYLGVSLAVLLYRVILGHYLNVSEERARQEFLERMQREAEEEAARAKKEDAVPNRGPAVKSGQPVAGKSGQPDAKAPKLAEAAKI